ncbi:unnamed protein product [Darwinula stevensoni]|uniref:Phenylalanine--tRNA ligase alpha subunit n=1 Tax=Darwinula stevensoni TaxID=69355 RepID=A0A7R9A9P4_9CRUS|nr:unnamed protein product [Darwinula stevensoni]CAG0897616.1 unnamed protein product [Darwinula stevensoni]
MAADLSEHLLHYLDEHESFNSLNLAEELGEDHQRIVGAIKSLQSLGNVIEAEQESGKQWELTEEGKEVVEHGSHEARVFHAIPPQGIPQQKLLKEVPNSKIGFSKAMSLGWVKLEKGGGESMVVRKTESIVDDVAEALRNVLNLQVDAVSNQQKQELKKRKLLQEVVVKMYQVKKGQDFTCTVRKQETELTAEMISSGSWKTLNLKPYNFNALGAPLTKGHLHPLMKVRAEFRQIFLEMGFTEMPTNNYVESSFWNFDTLFQPQQHPSRDAQDTFFVSDPEEAGEIPEEYMERVKTVHSHGAYGSLGYQCPWSEGEARKNVLRTHTTAVSARMLYALAKNVRTPSILGCSTNLPCICF